MLSLKLNGKLKKKKKKKKTEWASGCSSREKPSLLFIFPDFNSLVSGLWASVGVGD